MQTSPPPASTSRAPGLAGEAGAEGTGGENPREGAQGFNWVGLRGGTLSLDTQTNLKTAPFFGAQVGRVFEGQRFGLSFEVQVAHPESDLLPSANLTHSALSMTHLTGFLQGPSRRFWPYFGQGLGVVSIPKVTGSPLDKKTVTAAELHAALGFLHRPVNGFIWGLEGRYLFVFSNPDLKESRVSFMAGFTWGGQAKSSQPMAIPPPVASEIPVAIPVARPEPQAVPTRPTPSDLPTAANPEVTPSPLVAVRPEPTAAPPTPAVERSGTPTVSAVPQPGDPTSGGLLPEPAKGVGDAPPPTGEAPSRESRSERNQRLEALRKEDLATAVELGLKHLDALPAHRWTIRLEVATLSSTLKHAVVAFPDGSPDLFIAPMTLRDGRTAYQLFLSDFPSKGEAERAAKAVPQVFLEGGQRPRVVPVLSVVPRSALSPTPGQPALHPGPGAGTVPPVTAQPLAVATPTAQTRTVGQRTGTSGGEGELGQRLDALRQGDVAKAVALGRSYLATLPASHWTLRLEVARRPNSLKTAVSAFPGDAPDLWIAPTQLQSGTPAFQLFLSEYPTKAAAERAAERVPAHFLVGGHRPRVVSISGLLKSSESPTPTTARVGAMAPQASPGVQAVAESAKAPVPVLEVAPSAPGRWLQPHPWLWLPGAAGLVLLVVLIWRRHAKQ